MSTPKPTLGEINKAAYMKAWETKFASQSWEAAANAVADAVLDEVIEMFRDKAAVTSRSDHDDAADSVARFKDEIAARRSAR